MSNDSSLKVLIIDDDESVLEIVGHILEQAGFEVKTVFSAEEALEQLRIVQFHLIICDIVLPEMSGMDFLKKVKPDLTQARFLMMTNYGSLQQVEEALKYGAHGLISKPVRKAHLIKVVEYVLEKGAMSWEHIVSEENIYSYFPPPNWNRKS